MDVVTLVEILANIANSQVEGEEEEDLTAEEDDNVKRMRKAETKQRAQMVRRTFDGEITDQGGRNGAVAGIACADEKDSVGATSGHLDQQG